MPKSPFPRDAGYYNLREVDTNIYVGGVLTLAYRKPWDTIIDMIGASQGPKRKGDEDFRDGYLGYRVVVPLPMEDGDNVPEDYFKEAIKAVRGARGPILVHCHQGISRSVTMAYVILRLVRGMGHTEAYQRVVSMEGSRPMPETFLSGITFVETVQGSPLAKALSGRR